MANLVRLSALLVLVAGATGCELHGKHSYAGDNQRLIDTLPIYPGLQQTGDDSSWQYSEPNGQLFPENNHSGGTDTERYYAIPPGARCGQIIDWYGRWLTEHGWQTIGGSDYDVGWDKGTALIHTTCALSSSDFTIRADTHGSRSQ